jgi:hypothetical protein
MSALDDLETNASVMQNTSLIDAQALLFLIHHFKGKMGASIDEQPEAIQVIWTLYKGAAKGTHYLGTFETAWGLLNAITEYVNHHMRRINQDTYARSLLWGAKCSTMEKALNGLVKVSVR